MAQVFTISIAVWPLLAGLTANTLITIVKLWIAYKQRR